MNRRKVVLMLAGFETMLWLILILLYVKGTISLRLFIGLVLTLSVLLSALLIVILRKLND